MEEKINQALVQLENQLQGIVSAREQVEKTVKSSTDLQKVVSDYVSAVKKFCMGLKSYEEYLKAWEADLTAKGNALATEFESAIRLLNSTCSEIINSFDANVDKLVTDFKTKTDDTITNFVEQNKQLSENILELKKLREEIKKSIDEIKPIKDILTQISKDLKESQKEQDVVLNDIKQKVTEIPPTIKRNADDILLKLGSLNVGLLAAIGNNATKIESLKEKADGLALKMDSFKTELTQAIEKNSTKIDLLNEKSDNLKNATSHILSVLQSSSQSMISAISTSKEETAKSININRWIIIIGIIILAALQFFIK